MIDDDLPSDLRALFDAERGREAPAPQARQRVHQALAASIGGGFLPDPGSAPLDGGAASAAGAAGAGAGAAAGMKAVGGAAAKLGAAKLAAAGVGGGTAAATGAATGAAAGSALGKGLAIALAVAMAGTTATGVYLAQQDDSTPPVEATRDTEVPPAFDPSLLGARPPPPPLAPVAAPARPAPVDVAPAPVEQTPAERALRLAAERGLLDEARGAVSRNNGGAALIALEAHRTNFPDGQLVEEREALTVLALAKVGRNEEARDKAQRFARRWPQSLFATAVEQAAGSAP